MKYIPKHKTPEQILLYLGFKSANRGYVLKRKADQCRKDKPVQIHCLIDCEGVMITHEDYLGEDGKHYSSKSTPRFSRLFRFNELYKQVDLGRQVVLGKSLKKHYEFNKMPIICT
jgi:hypothetical protein